MANTPIPEAIPLPEIMIVPMRLLSAGTTEKLLNRIRKVKHVRQIAVSGENLPAKVNWGPGKGLDVDHDERREIKYGGQRMELKVQVGQVFAEINEVDSVPKALEEIEEICEEILPFGFQLEVGRYSKYRPTVTDYKKRMR
jgi:methyl-coenzyme M reductase subunit D